MILDIILDKFTGCEVVFTALKNAALICWNHGQLGPHKLGPILIQTLPLLKLIPTMLILFLCILFMYASYINDVCGFRNKFEWKWFSEGSILQMMATLLLPMD